jgi:hypothetical protein
VEKMRHHFLHTWKKAFMFTNLIIAQKVKDSLKIYSHYTVVFSFLAQFCDYKNPQSRNSKSYINANLILVHMGKFPEI